MDPLFGEQNMLPRLQRGMDPLQKIQQDMLLLKESMETMHDVVLDQQPMLDSIEEEIARSKEEVREGEQQMVEAAVEQSNSYRIYYLIAGAVTSIGTTVALLLLL
jgi:t-SNARE complex subunit (syntaxin)